MASAFHVWIDFDGTLVEPNVAMVLVEQFGRDGVREAREVDDLLHAGVITLREAWEREVAILPADRVDEMARYALDHAPLRAGARELIDLLERHSVPVVVISGGVDFYIEPILRREGIRWPFRSDQLIRTSGGALGVAHPFGHPSCRLCGICKAQAVRSTAAHGTTSVFIGDGSTDKYAAEVADVVFARRRLRDYCSDRNIPHLPFEDLHPVRRWFAERLDDGSAVGAARSRLGLADSMCPISRSLADPAWSGRDAPA